MNALVFSFDALAEVKVAVLSVLNQFHGKLFLATRRIGYCCVCSPLLFAWEILWDSPSDSPTYNLVLQMIWLFNVLLQSV